MEYTPQELSAILFYQLEDQRTQMRNDWERTRVSTYFAISVHIPKKQNFTYEKFKKDWPFYWDNERKPGVANPGEGVMSPEQWNKILNK